MKKLLFSLSLTLCFIGCSPSSEVPSESQARVEDDAFDSGVTEVYQQALSIAKRQKLIYKLDQIQNFAIYEYDSRKAFGNLPDSIDRVIFRQTGKEFTKQARVSSEQNLPVMSTVAMINAEIEASQYPSEQKQKMISLVNNVFAPADPIAASFVGTIGIWMYTVINSPSLSSQQKKELQNHGTMILELFKFVRDGGVNQIYNELTEEMPEYSSARTGRTTGCQVNTRNVLINAVYSGVKGAISGGLIGAAGGTVTIPIFGTVTGAVGGAVFGGALGFATGLVDGVVGELLQTCTRNVVNVNASCQQVLNNFRNGNSATRSYLLQNFRHCFKIDDTNLVLTPSQTNAEAVVITTYSGVPWKY